MRDAVRASGCEMVTVAIRRIDLDEPAENILDFLPEEILLLPNTAGCETADEAVRVARLARAGGLPPWIKLEVIADPRYLLPDPIETLRAAERLVAEGGVDAISVRAAAVGAGTTTRAVYSLFGSKDGLVQALAQRTFALLMDRVAAVATGGDPGRDLIA
jgi:thiazole synthase ThiGH ThiG subunit